VTFSFFFFVNLAFFFSCIVRVCPFLLRERKVDLPLHLLPPSPLISVFPLCFFFFMSFLFSSVGSLTVSKDRTFSGPLGSQKYLKSSTFFSLRALFPSSCLIPSSHSTHRFLIGSAFFSRFGVVPASFFSFCPARHSPVWPCLFALDTHWHKV